MKLSLLYTFPIMQFDTSTKIQILWCFFIDEVERVIRAAAVDDLEGFVAWDQNWVWWWVWYSKLCIFSGFRWLSSTLHAMVNFHHKVKFCNHAFDSKNTPCALACHQKRLWGWNGYAQICNKANFPKHSTEGRQVTSFFHAVIIFTVQLGS